ncbi:ATP-binding protein [Lapidilactobacillus mulanensis]|uniref:ATP-binding protein n=2 Tax=Lactobacillaceae TaxID=33958 RepID=A0ABW4DLX9_9LACO|nr:MULTISPECIES: ATP-binding protein [Lactobacillaceae]
MTNVSENEIAQQDNLESVEHRYRQQATILYSQFKAEGWHEHLGGSAAADAILD